MSHRSGRRLIAGVAALLLAAGTMPGAMHAAVPKCFGLVPTIVDTSGPDVLVGTRYQDVIAGLGGDDEIIGGGGGNFICGNAGDDDLFGEGGEGSAQRRRG